MSSNRPINIKDIMKGREKLEKQNPVIDNEEVQEVIKPIIQEHIHRHIIEHENNEDHRIIQGKINKVALARYLFPLCVGTFFGGMLWSWGGLAATMVVVLIFVGIIGAVMSS